MENKTPNVNFVELLESRESVRKRNILAKVVQRELGTLLTPKKMSYKIPVVTAGTCSVMLYCTKNRKIEPGGSCGCWPKRVNLLLG